MLDAGKALPAPNASRRKIFASRYAMTLAYRLALESTWTVAAETGISKSSVQRYFQLFGLQPNRAECFMLSTDPFFVEKLRDVLGLYLSPPDNALVLCVDEKSNARRWSARSRCCR